MASSPLTSIPVHQDVVRRLRSLKQADQTWDDFLLEMADDFVPKSWIEELERRAAEGRAHDVGGEKVFKEGRVRSQRRH